MDTPYIAQIVVGTVAKEFDEGSSNQKDAWAFLSSEIAKHENEVAVVITRDDEERIGLVWANYSALPFVETQKRFRDYLALLGFYEYDD
ncbi:hypothetical protein [Trinickia fusca]|uniref:Uncharacterized protein n=1 Tax=Trinickia fusca TaxID=2419777 RepID=A0A494X8H2_9BURK|nr:hypothetical protein [Trinickia fusca]RKP46848.1 hypothetical protein D7S89_15940 [Trinickia fusca]